MVLLCSAFAFLSLATILGQNVFAGPLPEALPSPPSAPHVAKGHLGAVASESSICSTIGIDMLKMGGNAADAVGGLQIVFTLFS